MYEFQRPFESIDDWKKRVKTVSLSTACEICENADIDPQDLKMELGDKTSYRLVDLLEFLGY